MSFVYNYTPEDISVDSLCVSIESSFPGVLFSASILSRPSPSTLRISFDVELTVSEEETLDTLVAENKADYAAELLRLAKAAKALAIDLRTDELIAGGFPFAGIQFSLTIESQVRIEGMDRFRDDPLCSYPISWNSLDDSQSLQIQNAATIHGLYLTALGTLRVRVDSGSALKDQVRAAATVAEVEAVVDNR
jgi:hypothetical protein